jgi:hypothetical protein
MKNCCCHASFEGRIVRNSKCQNSHFLAVDTNDFLCFQINPNSSGHGLCDNNALNKQDKTL